MMSCRPLSVVGWRWAAVAVTAVLTACTTPHSSAPAQSEQLLAQWGEPQASYTLPDDQQLWFYTLRGDAPGQRWRVVLDAKGQVVDRSQAFASERFKALAGHSLRAQEVLHRMGPPHRNHGGGESPVVWEYRFREYDEDLVARLQFNTEGVVSAVHLSPDASHREHYQ